MEEVSQPDFEALSANLGSEKARSAYELRTPINHVLSICEMLLEDREVPESFRADLSKIHQSGRKLINLMGDFLDDPQIFEGPKLQRLHHDLRTPVNHIIGYSEILVEDAAEQGREQLEADLGKIREAGSIWLNLMEDRLADIVSKDAESESAAAALSLELAAADSPGPVVTETGRILIVDDDELNRDVLARRLEQNGHQTAMAADGESALEVLAREPFDLVLLDMLMPGLSGMEVLSRMKADMQLKRIPVIVISALDDEAGIARSIELGAEDYLAKPFNPVVLRARIGSSLEKKRLREAERLYLARIEEEQRKSERLLLNVLPEVIADRLKAGEEGIADLFPEVTVLFADLVDFTEMSAETEPENIVGMLNRIFTSFDDLAARHGLEKIKTIGDAYMAVGGLPVPREDHAEAVARFAIDMIKAVGKLNEESTAEIGLRIGIASGPAVAGIIGKNKFIYDLWGDTVNTASRMESHGEAGRVHVSESTCEKLKDHFRLTARGEISVKGKGTMKTWFLDGERD